MESISRIAPSPNGLFVNCLPRGFSKDERSESEDSLEENFKSSNSYGGDKGDPVHSAFKMLNSYCKAQGITNSKVLYWDGQVREMLESVKKIRERIPALSKVDNAFNFREEGVKNEKNPLSEGDLQASFSEISKMDAILKLKATEEKKAKLARIQVEEESKDILKQLPVSDGFNVFNINFQEFMRLLNDVENTETGSTPSQQRKDQDEGKSSEEGKRVKLERQKSENFKFVERNIRLAKCGRGTLSLTDEEKSRLDSLLQNSKRSLITEKELTWPEETEEERCYGMDNETKAALEEIDLKLNALRKKKGRTPCSVSFLKKHNLEKKTDEDEKQNRNERKMEKSPNRLDKINKLLNLMNSLSEEEITPLTETEIANLLQVWTPDELKQSEEENCKKKDWLDTKPAENVIADLVSDAKSQMPKFKYRFDNS